MLRYEIQLAGPGAEADARDLAARLTPQARATVTPLGASKGLDPVAVITVTAAMLQSVDIIYRFYQDWRVRQHPRPGSRLVLTIRLPDGTSIELANSDPQSIKALMQSAGLRE